MWDEASLAAQKSPPFKILQRVLVYHSTEIRGFLRRLFFIPSSPPFLHSAARKKSVLCLKQR